LGNGDFVVIKEKLKDVGLVIEGSEEKGDMEIVGGYGGAQLGGEKGDYGQVASLSSGVKSGGSMLWSDGEWGLVSEEKLDEVIVAIFSSISKGIGKV